MIPVKRKRAPKGFNAKVLRPGRTWLRSRGLPLCGEKPKDVALEPFWRSCLGVLHRRYGGVCAYVSIYIDRITGARTVDHFVAKSSALEHAYRWSNYRLACQLMNSRKGSFEDVLDPFEIKDGTFVLNLLDGSIRPGPGLSDDLRIKAQHTINRLRLDEIDCRAARRDYFFDYLQGDISLDYLERKCPFVWYEVHRQKMFRSTGTGLGSSSRTS